MYGYRKYKVELTDHAYNRYRERGGMKGRRKLDAKISKIVNELLRGDGLKFSRNGIALISIGGGYLAVLRIERGVLSVRTIILRGGKREVERIAVC